ncbi:uncharacterized protein LOC123005225 [Tribolium madens]|uniref:uncharacterized protein LOC123005225 n=1 Tax=Tribolium madens TaxID=41895 RepID=UPI001CF730E4|nr:uncharacterized protein LOC123005225 [Tribolium madens]
MRSLLVQVLLLFLVSGETLKRSPLQVGLVTFTEKPHVGNFTRRVEGAHTKWVPGHVRHHSFIPAHLQHVFIPHVLFVHPYSHYREHIGGFGIGLDSGGRGAGHGFHVVFNF